MVKLTPELIEQCGQYLNAVRDRELDLRGYKIPMIENLGATRDQFDTIDFSDNELRKLDGFPLLRRLKCLLLNNNRICRIAENLETNIPVVETIVLTNNSVQELGDIDPLATLPHLTYLSLLQNPICSKKHYRAYVIHKIPQLRLLDFQKIKLKERQTAAQLFKGKKGQQLAKDLSKRSKTFVPGADLEKEVKSSGPSKEDVAAIEKAIANASSLEEVEKLNVMLRTGHIPGKDAKKKPGGKGGGDTEVQEVEDMDVGDQPPIDR